jgi:hypothetical protein
LFIKEILNSYELAHEGDAKYKKDSKRGKGNTRIADDMN